jgi:hypothetical protein
LFLLFAQGYFNHWGIFGLDKLHHEHQSLNSSLGSTLGSTLNHAFPAALVGPSLPPSPNASINSPSRLSSSMQKAPISPDNLTPNTASIVTLLATAESHKIQRKKVTQNEREILEKYVFSCKGPDIKIYCQVLQ